MNTKKRSLLKTIILGDAGYLNFIKCDNYLA